jgi:hypothetical protein
MPMRNAITRVIGGTQDLVPNDTLFRHSVNVSKVWSLVLGQWHLPTTQSRNKFGPQGLSDSQTVVDPAPGNGVRVRRSLCRPA